MNGNTKAAGTVIDICILLAAIVILLSVILKQDGESNIISTSDNTDYVYVIGTDIPPGEIQIRHVQGKGHMEIIKDGQMRAYSTEGAERLLPGKMEVMLKDGDEIHVSKDLMLILKYYPR